MKIPDVIDKGEEKLYTDFIKKNAPKRRRLKNGMEEER
jgi:hypothetical protein